jgi:hypothetical protein
VFCKGLEAVYDCAWLILVVEGERSENRRTEVARRIEVKRSHPISPTESGEQRSKGPISPTP